jgi:hypothetical protein
MHFDDHIYGFWQGENEGMTTHRKSPPAVLTFTHLSKTAATITYIQHPHSVHDAHATPSRWAGLLYKIKLGVVLYVHQTIVPNIYDIRCSIPTDTVAGKYDREGIECQRRKIFKP